MRQTQESVTIANAAATAWTNSAVSGDAYSAYYAAYNAAQYTYDATVDAIHGTAEKASVDAQRQWVQDVSGGWLTYWNDLADHAKTAADATTTAATVVTDAMAANAYTFAATVAPAIRTAADAEVNNGSQAIQSAAGFAITYTGTKIGNALTAAQAEISAWQSLQEARGDHWEQQCNLDAAAGVTFTGVNAGILAQFISPTQVAQPQALQAGAPPAPLMTKEEFDAKLRELVDQAKLDNREPKTAKLYKSDGTKDLFDENRKATPGIDCEDVADALGRFLMNHFTKGEGVTTSILVAGWVNLPIKNANQDTARTGTNSGHAFLIVEHGGQFWFVNEILGITEGPFADMDALKIAVEAHIVANYPKKDNTLDVNGKPEFPVTFNGPFVDLPALGAAMPDEPEPWYTSPEMRQRFANFLRSLNVSEADIKRNYFPAGFPPPAPTPPPPFPNADWSNGLGGF